VETAGLQAQGAVNALTKGLYGFLKRGNV
jgi:hypothetical protein